MAMRTLAALAATALGVPAAAWALFWVGTRTPTPQPDSDKGGDEASRRQ